MRTALFFEDDGTVVELPLVRRRSFIPSIPPRNGTTSWLHISTRRVGGLRFVKIGRLCFSFCITARYHPL